MAKYKISLLTSVADGNTSYFLPTVLGTYNDQINYNKNLLTAHKNNEQSFCYTYNEKFSTHQNAQKELSFSMDRNILLHDEWMVNPHIAALHVGSIIELIDKYGQTYLFIIKQIAYTFKEHNITYNYTCQDAFSYQYTRQQSGYTIENDASSDTFIGPKTIDWWVIKKIVPECYVEYEYVPLKIGLYRDNNGIHRFTSEEREVWVDDISNKKTILKEPFENEEYQTTFAFSCSNSNANAALISLGDNLELMIHTHEEKRPNKNTYYHFFWYEPKQNQDVTGLKYSPKTQISNFNLNFAGDSLTTVLNVNSHEVGDDLITLLPQTPSLFTNYFMTNDWLSSTFKPGFFNDFISGKKYKNLFSKNENDSNTIAIEAQSEVKSFINILTPEEAAEKFIAIKLFNINNANQKLKLSLFYNLFSDNWEQQRYTSFEYNVDGNSYFFNGNRNHMYLIIKDPNQSEQYHIIHEDSEIPQTLLGDEQEVYLGIRTNSNGSVNITNINLYLNFYRIFTEEEKEFATVADQCPWLENRLIDFSYFLQQHIISKQEYETLMNKLQNDLRIINGKLLFLSDSYYRALKKKTEILAKLTTSLDSLSATFNADIVNPLQNGKTIKNVDSFLKAYNEIFKIKQSPLLDYTDVLSDYFEKYFNSEQRFLKNVYAFRKYFDDPCTFSYDKDAGIYVDTITSAIKDDYFIAFGEPTFVNQNLYDHLNDQWFYQQDGKYTIPNFITDVNKTQYYKPSIQKDRLILLNGNENNNNFDFSKNASYYLTQQDYNKYFGSIARDINDISTYVDQDDDQEIVYYKLNSTELKRLVINEHPTEYYLRDNDTYCTFDNVRATYGQISERISWITLPNLMSYWSGSRTNKKVDVTVWNDKNDNTHSFFWDYYKAFIPLDTIYYKGPVIKTSSKTITEEDDNGAKNTKTQWVIQRINELGKPDNTTTYVTYQPISFAGNGYTLKNWGDLSTDAAVDAKQKLQSSWNYAAFNYAPSGWNIAAIAAGCMSGFLIAPWAGFLGIALTAISASYHQAYDESWCKWETNTDAYRSFEGRGDVYHVLNEDSGEKLMPNDFMWTSNGAPYYNYDSYYANYAISTDASSQHMLQTALFNRIFDSDKAPVPQQSEPQITWYKDYGDWANTEINTQDFNLSDEKGYKLYQYFNFYKYVVPTYSFRIGNSRDTSLYVKNKYFRVLTKDSKINCYDTYLRVPVYENNEDGFSAPLLRSDEQNNKSLAAHTKFIYITDPEYFYKNSKNYVFSALRWYPLYNSSTDLNLKALDIWKDRKSYTLDELINKTNIDSSHYDISKNIVRYSGNNYCAEYMYVHVEDYVRKVFDSSNMDDGEPAYNKGTTTSTRVGNLIYAIDTEVQLSNNKTTIYKAEPTLSKVYLIDDDSPVNPLERPGALKLAQVQLYMISDQDAEMIPIETSDTIDTTRCYQLDAETGEYTRIYSRQQIAQAQEESGTEYCDKSTAKKFCYISGTSTQITNFTPHTKQFITNLYLCHFSSTDGVYKIIAKSYSGNNIIDFNTSNYDDQNIITKDFILLDENGAEYKSTIKVQEEKQESLTNISNGTFWYRYHSRIDLPTLFEYAASIETQLQTYWDQAYTASKYCKYFLPESWQPQTGDTINAFAKNIIIPQMDTTDKTIINVTLSDYYLPYVDIYVNDTYETFKYKHYLTKFLWKYNPSNTYSWKQLTSNEDAISNQDNNYIKASSVPVLQNNTGVLDILSHLNTSLSDWEVMENGYTVYYYRTTESSGMLWKDLAFEINNTSIFEHFDGLYGMMYYLLSQNYTDCVIKEYEKAQQQKQTIWNQIYNEYPFLMLEDNYSYSLATTSTELLKMAQLVFKGKKQPERNYNISILDVKHLNGYFGQELKPGQGIQINANDYYDENDDIYNALSQYLFITDVSYNLRNDAEVSITVNSIKYQEKLLQSLVKLIR